MKNNIQIAACGLWIVMMCGCAVHHTNTITSSAPRAAFDKEGHRGCAGWMPENTIPAMLKAIEIGVTTLEMDAHITSDSEVVLSHDHWLNPAITTKPDGSLIDSTEPKYILYNMTYDSIRRFDVGGKPYSRFPRQQKMRVSMPLLSDLIDSVEAYCKQHGKRVDYNIEIKSSVKGDGMYHPEPIAYTARVMRLLIQKNILPHVIIQSFDNRPLQYMHQHYPAVRTSLLIEDFDKRSLQQQFTELGFIP